MPRKHTKPQPYTPGYSPPFSAAFGAWLNDHEAVPIETVLKQLLMIPIGRSGVAGRRGSGWDATKWSPHGNGSAVGPGVIVKRVDDDLFLVGCVRPLVTAVQAAERIVGLC